MTNLTAAASNALNAIRTTASCHVCRGEGASLQHLLGSVLSLLKGSLSLDTMRASVYTSTFGACRATFRQFDQDFRLDYNSDRGWFIATTLAGDAKVELGSDQIMHLVQDFCAANPML